MDETFLSLVNLTLDTINVLMFQYKSCIIDYNTFLIHTKTKILFIEFHKNKTIDSVTTVKISNCLKEYSKLINDFRLLKKCTC